MHMRWSSSNAVRHISQALPWASSIWLNRSGVRPMSLSLYVRFQRDLVSGVTSVCPRRRSVSCALRSARAAVVRHSDPWPGIRGVVLGPRHPLATPIARRLAAS
jgi:hypothetical protein